MIGGLETQIARMTSARRCGWHLVLLLDYDGTLTPIVDYPSQATLTPGTRDLLRRLADLDGVTVGVVSGRALDDLKEMVALPGLCYAGLCGLELEWNGVRTLHPAAEAGRGLVAQAASALQELELAFPGAWVEHKRYGLTLHYRAVAAERVEGLLERVDAILGPWAECLRIMDGPKAVEVTGGGSKADAVRAILARVGSSAFPLVAGDGANDADALATVRNLGGVSIGVGPVSPSAAEYHIADPPSLVRWLTRLLQAQAFPGENC